MGMEIVNTAHKSYKNICSRTQEVKSVYKCTTLTVTGPCVMFEVLT